MKKQTISKVLLAILTSAGFTTFANAATLGTLTTYSFLNEPLHALIEVSGVSADKNLDAISATIGSAEMYQQSGLRRPAWLEKAQISVARMDNGKIALKITAPIPIEDPASALIVMLTIENVAAKKEYALILDPKDSKESQQIVSSLAQTSPVYTPNVITQDNEKFDTKSESNTQIKSPLVSQNGTQIIKKPSTKVSIKKEQQSVEEVAARNVQPNNGTPNNEQITVASGDTLGKIVSKMPTNSSAHQWMVAFVKQNPHAFEANNINRLKSGAILKIPTSEQAKETSRELASKEVSQQMQDWNSWRQSALRSASPKTKVPDSLGQGSVQKAPTPKVSQEDALKIEQSPKSKANEIAQNKQIQEANDRAKELEKIAQDMRSLLELKNQQIAQMQKELEEIKDLNKKPTIQPEQAQQAVPAQSAASEPSTTENNVQKDTKPAEQNPNAPVAQPATPAASQPAPQPVAKPKTPSASKPKVRQPLVIPPVEEPKPEELDLLGIVASPFGAGAGAILALLFGLFGFKQYQKRKQRLSGATRSPETFGPGNVGEIDPTQMPEDLELSQVEEHIKGSDTFYAFGKFEKSLNEVQLALEIEPDNANALIRALRCCAKTHQSDLFAKYHQDLLESAEQTESMLTEAQTLAKEIFESKTQNSFLSEMDSGEGLSSLEDFLSPHDDNANATENIPNDSQQIQVPITEINFEIDSKILEEPETTASATFSATSAQEEILDFKQASKEVKPNTEKTEKYGITDKSDDNLMEFNLPNLNIDKTQIEDQSTAPVSESFDLSLPDDLSPTPSGLEDFVVPQNVEIQPLNIQPLISPEPNIQSQSLSLDSNQSENAEMRTMLDLAKAYHEMGDVDGAKELLNEIIQEDPDGIVGQEAKQFQQSI